MKKRYNTYRLGIRLHAFNRLTMPVLLNQLGNSNLEKKLEIKIIRTAKQLYQFISGKRPALLLYSFMTPNQPAIEREMNWISKRKNDNVRLVVGGPHCSGDPASCLKLGFDFAITGAAEMGLLRFVESFLGDNLPDAPTLLHLPELDHLDKSLPISKYLPTSPPLEITRGCYWNCKFCQTACQKIIHRSLASVADYLDALKEKGHHRRINFICPSASEYGALKSSRTNLDAIETLLRLFKEKGTSHLEFGIFPSEVRPNRITGEFLNLVKKYCSNRRITIGAQSGSESLLKKIKRGHTVADIEVACKHTARMKLIPHVDIILGFPEESRRDRRETLSLCKMLTSQYRARIHMHYFLPLAGTDFADSYPKVLDYRTIDTIEEMEKDGLCTGWWREGRRLSLELVEVRDRLKTQPIEYQQIDWR
jgi:B12-binding domain/radical SAM domain protein